MYLSERYLTHFDFIQRWNWMDTYTNKVCSAKLSNRRHRRISSFITLPKVDFWTLRGFGPVCPLVFV